MVPVREYTVVPRDWIKNGNDVIDSRIVVAFFVFTSTVYPVVLKSFGIVEFTMPAISKSRKSCPSACVAPLTYIVIVRARLFTTTPSSARPPCAVPVSSALATPPPHDFADIPVTFVRHLNVIVPDPGPLISRRFGELISCLAPEMSNPAGKERTMVPPFGICFDIGNRTEYMVVVPVIMLNGFTSACGANPNVPDEKLSG